MSICEAMILEMSRVLTPYRSFKKSNNIMKQVSKTIDAFYISKLCFSSGKCIFGPVRRFEYIFLRICSNQVSSFTHLYLSSNNICIIIGSYALLTTEEPAWLLRHYINSGMSSQRQL
jgi:hypothetical protein